MSPDSTRVFPDRAIALVIDDAPDGLLSFIPEGSPFGFPPGNWPTPDGKHPWAARDAWSGHGCLMYQPVGANHAIQLQAETPIR